ADGAGSSQRMQTSPYWQLAASWSPSGLAYVEFRPESEAPREIWVLPTSGEKPVRVFSPGIHPRSSLDGSWIAYTSWETRPNQVDVQPYPGPGDRVRVSTEQGQAPVWRNDNREIFYLLPVGRQWAVMAADVETSPQLKAATPHKLFEAEIGYKAGQVP